VGLTVSAIVPNYNHAAFVARAIRSILNQGPSLTELLLIDDASTDDSVARIEGAIRGDPRARLLRNESNRGVIPTLNRGLAEVRGDLVLLAAADDEYLPDMAGAACAALAAHPGAAFACGDLILAPEGGTEQPVSLPFGYEARYVAPAELIALARRRNVMIFSASALMRRDAILAAGGLLPELRWHGDWLLLFVLALRHGFCYVPRDFTRLRVAAATYSQNRHKWTDQRSVLMALYANVRARYPDTMPLFRRAAVLPTYDMAFLPALLGDPALRYFLTPLLAWRLVTYQAMSRASQIVPWRLRQRLRAYLRL
jgi:glycosyltransferase involved in cell wall biosynthesis